MRPSLALAVLLAFGCGDDTGAGPPDAPGTDARPDAATDARADAPRDAPLPDAPGDAPADGPTSDGGWTPRPYPDCPDCQHAQYVVASLVTPQTNGEANDLGCDIDGNLTVDNRLGRVLVSLRAVGPGLDVQPAVDQAFQDGRVIMLHDVEYKPTLATTAVAGIRAFVGTHDPSDGLVAPTFYLGNGRFMAAPPGDGFGGAIVSGVGSFGPGSLDFQLPLVIGQPPLALRLEAASASGVYTSTTVTSGKLCGAIPIAVERAVLIPGIADLMSAAVKRNDAVSATLRSLFDADMSCSSDPDCTTASSNRCRCITAGELENNSVSRTLLSPDLDLDPSVDNPFVTDPSDPSYFNDALSVGVGFTANRAQFPSP